jgi:chorismate synthase
LETTLARVESEATARRTAEETTSDLEKEKSVRELEIQENERRFLSEINNKEEILVLLKNKENEYSKTIEVITKEKEELNSKIYSISQGMKCQFNYIIKNFM